MTDTAPVIVPIVVVVVVVLIVVAAAVGITYVAGYIGVCGCQCVSLRVHVRQLTALSDNRYDTPTRPFLIYSSLP